MPAVHGPCKSPDIAESAPPAPCLLLPRPCSRILTPLTSPKAAAEEAAAAIASLGAGPIPARTMQKHERSHQERFGLWTRKRCWAATVLQAFVRARLLKPALANENEEGEEAAPVAGDRSSEA